MINCGIYQWTNKITGKIYIGQSCNLIKRKKLFSNFKSYHYAGKLINEERKKYPSLKYWDFLYFLTQYICSLHLLAINLHMNFIN